MVRPLVVWSAAALSLMLGCGGSTEQTVVAPTTARCQVSLAPQPALPAAGAQVEAQLTVARDCVWSARTGVDWLHVAPDSGQGDATLSISAAANPQGRTRSAPIDINGQQFTINQDGQPCRFEATPRTLAVPHQGGRRTLELSTLEGCSCTTQSSQPWLRVVSGSGGDASATLELAVDSNAGAERSAVLTIATLLVAVHQDAGPDDRTECRYSIDPGARTIPAAGGTATFDVSTLPGCAWGAASSQSWLTVISNGNGFGAARVQYRVDANSSTSGRSATIAVGTRRHVVTQEGIRP